MKQALGELRTAVILKLGLLKARGRRYAITKYDDTFADYGDSRENTRLHGGLRHALLFTGKLLDFTKLFFTYLIRL